MYVVTSAATGGTNVSAFDVATGALRFQADIDAGHPTAPAVTPELLLIGTGNGHLHALNSTTGEAVAEIALPVAARPVFNEMVVADGRCLRKRTWVYLFFRRSSQRAESRSRGWAVGLPELFAARSGGLCYVWRVVPRTCG